MSNISTTIDFSKFVEAKNGNVFTTSLLVAKAFGRLHKDVLRSVSLLDCTPAFTERNFALSEYADVTGRKLPAYEMTKDGFIFLVMKFAGKKAAAIQEGYINAFNSMAEQLGKSAQTIVEDIIGTAGVNVLNNVIHQKALRLPAEKQRSFACTIKSRLRGRFNVARVEQIPSQELADACNFIAAYALEGEYLEKLADGGSITLSESEASHLYSLMSHFFYLHELNAKHRIATIGQKLGSKPLLIMGERISEAGWAFQQLDKRRDELYKIRTKLGVKGGYAELLKDRLFNDYSKGFAV
ncbi:MAG: Rha family transcriptional regulator [Desulfuromonas sp.]|nr:Rha family transcriptional regulator [Desulfuromonas sp.]